MVSSLKKIALIAAVLLPAIAHGQIYKWVDEDGVTHFGSKPPVEPHEEIEIERTNSSAPPVVPPGTQLRRALGESHRRPRPTANQRSSTPDYLCTELTNQVTNAKERWDAIKRNGYSQGQRQQHEQRIKEAERRRDNLCR